MFLLPLISFELELCPALGRDQNDRAVEESFAGRLMLSALPRSSARISKHLTTVWIAEEEGTIK